MRRTGMAALLVVIASFTVQAIAFAKDYCLNFPSQTGIVLVGQGFSIPSKGKCKTFLGFASGSLVI